MPGRHPAEFLPPVLYRQRARGGVALVPGAGIPSDHYEFEVFDIAGALPYRMKDGFLLPDNFMADGWKLQLDPAYVARQVRKLSDGSPVMRDVRRRGWRDFRFFPVYVIISEWRTKSSADSFQETAEVNWNQPQLEGQVQERTGKLEIDGDQLSGIGLYAYQYQFLPLLKYARQFPPFVKS